MLTRKDRAEVIGQVRAEVIVWSQTRLAEDKKRFETAGDPLSYYLTARMEAWREFIDYLVCLGGKTHV